MKLTFYIFILFALLVERGKEADLILLWFFFHLKLQKVHKICNIITKLTLLFEPEKRPSVFMDQLGGFAAAVDRKPPLHYIMRTFANLFLRRIFDLSCLQYEQ